MGFFAVYTISWSQYKQDEKTVSLVLPQTTKMTSLASASFQNMVWVREQNRLAYRLDCKWQSLCIRSIEIPAPQPPGLSGEFNIGLVLKHR